MISSAGKFKCHIISHSNRVRKLAILLRRPKAKRLFEAYQKQANVPLNILLCDVATRWNSVYVMLQRCFEQKPAIKLAEDDEELNFTQACRVSELRFLSQTLDYYTNIFITVALSICFAVCIKMSYRMKLISQPQVKTHGFFLTDHCQRLGVNAQSFSTLGACVTG